MAPAHRGIADAEQDEIALERAGCVHIAIGDDESGPGEGFRGDEREGRGGSGELGAGSGCEKAGIVEAVERLAVERGHADAELSVAQRGVGENGLDAVSERTGHHHRARSTVLARPCLRAKPLGGKQDNRQQDRKSSPKRRHGGSLRQNHTRCVLHPSIQGW